MGLNFEHLAVLFGDGDSATVVDPDDCWDDSSVVVNIDLQVCLTTGDSALISNFRW